MATADLIQELNQDLNSAYAKVAEKGGTVPEQKNSNNLASAIDSIQGGGARPPLPEYPYPVEEFDGGEFGALAYLRDDTVHYYTAVSSSDLKITTGTTTSSTYTIKTLDDGFAITNKNILAYAFGSSATTTANYTLSACQLLQSVKFSEDSHLTSIGQYFCAYCNAFNCPLDIPEGVTSIGIYFLYGSVGFNQPITLPSSLTYISNSFLNNCTSFNQPIIFPDKLATIEYFFLRGCTAFNQPLWLKDSLTAIGYGFLNGCTSFNQPLTIPDTTTISNIDNSEGGFLSGCTSFNQPIELPASMTTVPIRFLKGCTSFNSSVGFRGEYTAIGNYFLYQCTSFNQPLSLPDAVTSIGSDFLSGCTSFNQPLSLPDTVNSVGGSLLYNTDQFVGPLNVGKAYGFLSSNYSLSTVSNTAPMYTEGITIVGENAEGWMAGLPNRTSSPYRKLINGNA